MGGVIADFPLSAKKTFHQNFPTYLLVKVEVLITEMHIFAQVFFFPSIYFIHHGTCIITVLSGFKNGDGEGELADNAA